MDRSEATCPEGVAAVRRQPSNQTECPATPDLFPQRSHQPVVVDRIEERLEVAIDHLAAAFRPAGFHFGHRVVRGMAGPVAVAKAPKACRRFGRSEAEPRRGEGAGGAPESMFAEIRFKARSQHLRDGLLDHAIQHRRNPQRTLRPVGLATAMCEAQKPPARSDSADRPEGRIIHTRRTGAGR